MHTHIEPLARHRLGARAADATTRRPSARRSSRPCRRFTGAAPLDVTFRDGEQGRVALVTVGLPGEQPLPSAHQPRGRDRGGRARALPGARRRDRAHRADGAGVAQAPGGPVRGRLEQIDGGRGAHREQHSGVAVVAARAAAAARRSGRSRRSRARRFGRGARGYSDADGRHAHPGARRGAAPRAVRRRARRRPAGRRRLAGGRERRRSRPRARARRAGAEAVRGGRPRHARLGRRSRPSRSRCRSPGGAVFASRTPRWTLAAVAKRGALSSLMLYDLRAVLGELEGGPPIRRSASADERAAGPATEEHAAEELPMPELGGETREGEAQGPALARGRPRGGHGRHRPAHAARARAARPRVRPDRLRAPDPARGARARPHHGGGGADADARRRGASDARRPRAGGARARARARARRRHGRAVRRGAPRLRASRSTTAAWSARRAAASAAPACAWCRATRPTTATWTGSPRRTCCAWPARCREAVRGDATRSPPRSERPSRARATRSRRRPEEVEASRKAELLRACDERARAAGRGGRAGAHRLRRERTARSRCSAPTAAPPPTTARASG